MSQLNKTETITKMPSWSILSKWLRIRMCQDCHIFSLLFSILHNPIFPTYLHEHLKYLIPRNKFGRSSSSLLLLLRDGSFKIHAVRLWNRLPHSIGATTWLANFRYFLKIASVVVRVARIKKHQHISAYFIMTVILTWYMYLYLEYNYIHLYILCY